MSLRRACPLLLGALLATVPLMSATAAPKDPAPAPGPVAQADENGAMAQAKREHRRVEVASLTTERRKVVADPGTGRFEAQINANPVRVQRGGTWVDLDASLHRSGGRVRPAAAKVDLDVTDGGSGPLVTVADAGKSFGLTWAADKSLPSPVVKGDKAVYSDVRPGIDLVVQTNAYGFSQYLVVRTRAAAADPLLRSFAFDVSAPGLAVSKVDGGLEARDSSGEAVFVAPRLQMWSSTGKVPTGSSVDASAYVTGSMEQGKTADVDFTLKGNRLTLTPDRSVLDDPDVTYPVVIDPSISKKQKNWAMVWSNGMEFWNPDDDDHSARVGYDGWSGQNKKSRVFYTFDTTALAGKDVSSATFTHKQIHSPSFECNQKDAKPAVNLDRSGTISSSTKWPGPSTYDFLDDSKLAVGSISKCDSSLQEWKATDGAKDAAANKWDTLTLRLASDDEGDKWGWRQYQNTSSYPVLSVTYNTAPLVPDAVSVAGLKSYAGASYLGTTTPKLTVTVKDADSGDGVKGVFIVNPIDPADSLDDRTFLESGNVTSPGTSTGKPVSVTVPAGVLANGQSYSIYARADDGDVQTVSGPSTHLLVDTVAPGAPTLTGPTGTIAQGATVTFHVDAPEGDVAGYVYGLNSGTPSTTVNAASLGAAVDIPVVARQFGPNVFTVQSVDRAGNRTATPVRFEFKVDGTLPSNRYRLDKNGTDTRTGTALGSAPSNLAVPTSPAPTWVPGRDATVDGSTTTRDCTDSALQLSPTTALKSVTTATNHPLDTSASFTASAWLKTDDLSTTSSGYGERYAVTMPVGPSNVAFSLGYRKDTTTGTVYWLYTLDDATDSVGRMWVQDTPAASAVTAGRWTHVAGVYDAAAGTASLYVDGRLVANKPATVKPSRGTQLSLGTGGYSTTQLTWNGAVDEVLLYQGALDATQVREQFALRRPTTAC